MRKGRERHIKKQQKEERRQIFLKENAQKDKEAVKAEKPQKNPYSVFSKNDEEDDMEDDSVVFIEPSTSDHLPKGTLSRLPLTYIMEGFNLTIILLSLLILFSNMDFKHKNIQWNCRGLKPNYNEVPLMISEYNPSVFCFQETFLKLDDMISLKGFTIYNYVHTDCLRPSCGASIFRRFIQCYSVLSDILVKMSYAYRWKGDQMFYLLVKVSFAYLLPVSFKSLYVSVLSTKRQFRSVL